MLIQNQHSATNTYRTTLKKTPSPERQGGTHLPPSKRNNKRDDTNKLGLRIPVESYQTNYKYFKVLEQPL
jgi:hypothetical protein